jgi:hypothetical protein
MNSNPKTLYAMCDPRLSYISSPLPIVETIPPGFIINKETPNQESYYTVKIENTIDTKEIKE